MTNIKYIVVVLSFFSCAWTFQKKAGSAQVKILTNGNPGVISLGYELKKNETLLVGENTKVLLTEGKSELWVGENSSLRIDSLAESKSDAIRLDFGKVRVKVAPEQAPKWKFTTPSAVSGVRGTEFFISSSASSENICVLEGVVASELVADPSKKFIVPAGKGVQIREGKAPIMADNSNFLVNQWLAETSINDDIGYIPAAYANSVRTHKYSDSVSYSLEANLFYCDHFNADFDRSISDTNKNCFRNNLYPSLSVQAPVSFRLTPRLSYVAANQDSTFDAIPLTTRRDQSVVTISEAYAKTDGLGGDWQIGFQKLNLSDGFVLTDAKFSNEPLTQLGINFFKKIADHEVEFFVSQGLEGKTALDGSFPHSLALIDLKLFKSRGEVYLLQVDSLDPKNNPRPEIHQSNFAFLFNDRSLNFDYNVSAFYQGGKVKSLPTAAEVSVNDTFFDLQFGYYPDSKLRLFTRALEAGKNYSTIAPASYSLGLFPGFYQIGNIRQARAGVQYRLSENKHLTYEYIATWDKEKDGLIKYRSAASGNSFIAEENNILFNHKWNDYLSYRTGAFWFLPHGYSTNSDASYGVQAWLIGSL